MQLPAAAAAAKSLQSCPTLCDPIDGSPPGSPVPGILQPRALEWVAISFSNTWKWKVKVKSLSRVRLLATPWTAAHQAPPSMGFSRQEYWSGVPLPSPGLAVGKNNICCTLPLGLKVYRMCHVTPVCSWKTVQSQKCCDLVLRKFTEFFDWTGKGHWIFGVREKGEYRPNRYQTHFKKRAIREYISI